MAEREIKFTHVKKSSNGLKYLLNFCCDAESRKEIT